MGLSSFHSAAYSLQPLSYPSVLYYVLPREEWLSAADDGFDQVFSACSTSQSLSPSQLLTQMLKVFIDSKICVNERNCGISKGFLLEYIAQRSVPSDDALASVST